MIILDDAGQYENKVGDGWRIVSSPVRFRTLGEKRNASAALVSPDVDAYCVWDDGIYLPWHMSAVAAALANADYAIPTLIYVDKEDHLRRKINQWLFHGAWSLRKEALDRVCGYSFIQSGQDQGLLKRFKAANLRLADPITFEARPSYIYRWFTAHDQHISAMGTNGYERLGKQTLPCTKVVDPRWEQEWTKVPIE